MVSWCSGCVQISVRLSGSVKCSLVAYCSGPVSLCLSWRLALFQLLPSSCWASIWCLSLSFFFLLLPLYAQGSLFFIPPFFIPTSFLSLPLSAPGDTKKDAELHCYVFVYLTYSFYLLPPLLELGPIVLCITWPLLQGTSASLSPELWYWNDSSSRELNRVSVEMHWGKGVQQEACRIARYSEEWGEKSRAEKRQLSQYSV